MRKLSTGVLRRKARSETGRSSSTKRMAWSRKDTSGDGRYATAPQSGTGRDHYKKSNHLQGTPTPATPTHPTHQLHNMHLKYQTRTQWSTRMINP